MFSVFRSKNYQRTKLLNKTNSDIMKEYLEEPFPDKNELIRNIDIVSVDFETTGLDVENDEVVSMGWVNINQLGVDLNSCHHQLITISGSLPEKSVVIHNITDNQLGDGVSIEEGLSLLLRQLKGKVMLVHGQTIEMGFINKMCQRLYGTDFVIPIIVCRQAS